MQWRISFDTRHFDEILKRNFLFQFSGAKNMSCLTPNTPLLQLWCARSKLNMNEICSLNIHLWYVDIPQKVLLKFLHVQRRSFLLPNLQFDAKISPEVKKIFQKRLCAWRNFKIIFSRPLFIIIFRKKILFSCPYSILIGHIKVESK